MVPRAVKPGAGWDNVGGSRTVWACATSVGLALSLLTDQALAAEVPPVLTLDLLDLLGL